MTSGFTAFHMVTSPVATDNMRLSDSHDSLYITLTPPVQGAINSKTKQPIHVAIPEPKISTEGKDIEDWLMTKVRYTLNNERKPTNPKSRNSERNHFPDARNSEFKTPQNPSNLI